jgi:cyclopropane fatty-acyl-phospholipid synthase-like methyltransferase
MAGGYDDGYVVCPCFWGRQPGRLVRSLVGVLGSMEGLEILDAGCGEGKNAVYLAQLGAKVRAIDVSFHALANARRAWGSLGTNCEFELSDIQEVHLAASFFDAVIAYGLMHCLPDETAISDMIRRFQSSTKTGGYNVVVTFNSRRQDLRAHPELRPCLLEHGNYVEMYREWDLIQASDEDLQETHPNNNLLHVHSMTRILAKKIQNNVHPTST